MYGIGGEDKAAKWGDNIAELEDMINALDDGEVEEGENNPVNQPVNNQNYNPATAKPKITDSTKSKRMELEVMKEDDLLNHYGIKDDEPPMKVQPPVQNKILPPATDMSQPPQYSSQTQPREPQRKAAPKGNGVEKIIEVMEITREGKYIKTLSAINAELAWISENLKGAKLPPQFKGYFETSKNTTLNQRGTFINFIKEGKIDERRYESFVNESILNNQELFKKMKDSRQPDNIIRKIAQRLQNISNEKKMMEEKNGFLMVLKTHAPEALKGGALPKPMQSMPAANIADKESKKFGSENTGSSKKELGIAKRPISEFQGNVSISSFDEMNRLPIEEKIRMIRKRHKQYHNLAMYFSTHMKDLKAKELSEFYFPLLGKSKAIRDELEKGINENIADFLRNEMKEITPETFHGMNMINLEAELKKLLDRLKNCYKDEADYMKMASRSVKTKHLAEESAKKLEFLKAFEAEVIKITKNPFIPLPRYEVASEKKVLAVEDRNVEANFMIFSLVKATDCKSDKYSVKFSLKNMEGSMFAKETPFCESNCIFQYTEKIQIGKDRRNLFLDIVKESITLRVFRKGFFGTKEFGIGEISLAELEFNNKIEGKVRINSEAKPVMSLTFSISIREPIGKQTLKSVEVFKVLQIYPPFDKDAGVEEFIKESPVLANLSNSNKITEPQKPAPQKMELEEESKREEPPSKNTTSFAFVPHEEKHPDVQKIRSFTQLPNGITADDLLNPENPNKAPVMSFLGKFNELYPDQKAKYTMDGKRGEGKILEAKAMECYKFFLELEGQIQNEKLDLNSYLGMLENSNKRDSILISIYKSLGLKNWASFCETRMEYASKEINDIKSMME